MRKIVLVWSCFENRNKFELKSFNLLYLQHIWPFLWCFYISILYIIYTLLTKNAILLWNLVVGIKCIQEEAQLNFQQLCMIIVDLLKTNYFKRVWNWSGKEYRLLPWKIKGFIYYSNWGTWCEDKVSNGNIWVRDRTIDVICCHEYTINGSVAESSFMLTFHDLVWSVLELNVLLYT